MLVDDKIGMTTWSDSHLHVFWGLINFNILVFILLVRNEGLFDGLLCFFSHPSTGILWLLNKSGAFCFLQRARVFLWRSQALVDCVLTFFTFSFSN